ncbi:MAG: aminotransferase [Methanobacteriota archaeon]|jgi:isopenicillin-N epimerase|nr:MAG: aminotransferase [Euryarchaeota archaeon]
MPSLPSRSKLSKHWILDPNITFLNHGSFGACPKLILDEQTKLRTCLESDPVTFMESTARELWAESLVRLSKFINADSEGMTFVTNATSGVNTVLKSLDLKPNDEIIVLDHSYQACWNAVDFITKKTGAKTVVAPIPFPIDSNEQIIEGILQNVTERTRLALIDTVTSPTGLRLPFEELVSELQSRNVDVLLDAAHGPGIVTLDIKKLDPAYVTGNAHKGLCTPKGSAFLYIREDRRNRIRPLSVSHGASVSGTDQERFRFEFDWTGTQDPTAWLCIPSAINHIGSMLSGGWPAIMDYNTNLAIQGRNLLLEALGTPKPSPDSMIVGLAAVLLPGSGVLTTSALEPDPLHTLLFEKYRIQVPVFGWPHHNKRYLRIASYLYNSLEEYEYLAEALKKEI